MDFLSQINPEHKYLLINGPARSGKDTLAQILATRRPNIVITKFAAHLKDATHAAYGILGVPHDHYESAKELPSDDFFGLTPRQAYIKFSETYMKVHHGKDVFAKLFVRYYKKLLLQPEPLNFLISDSGFIDETLAFASIVGPQNVQLVRIHREGYDFSGDSREYVYPDTYGVLSFDVTNETGNINAVVEAVEHEYFNSLLLNS